jgi:hypothetical protein
VTNQLAPEYRFLAKAQKFSKGELPPESQKMSKLLTRICKEPDNWLETYRRFNDPHWAIEVFVMGLNSDEQETLVKLLEKMKISGIRLSTSEGYKALAVSGLKEHLRLTHENLRGYRQELEHDLKAVIRYDNSGIVISGYKRGWPFTTYIGKDDFFHKVYLDKQGRFETIRRVSESRLSPQEDLRYALVKAERAIVKLRETWDCWKAEESVRIRLDNLEKFSDTGGALS